MFTSDQLIAQLKKRVRLPDNTFDDQDLLDFATTALTQDLLPELIKNREEFYVKAETFIVPGGESLRIPARAYAGVIREIKLVMANGSYVDLNRVYEEDVGGNTVTNADPNAFLVRGNNIIPFPQTSQTVTLYVSYWLAPPNIVPVAECAVITGIVGNIVTCEPPTSWTTSNRFDIVKGTSDYEPILVDQSSSSIVPGSQMTLTAAPVGAAVGDFICLAGQSPYAYLQSSYYPALIQLTISLIHEALGDLEQKQASDGKAEALLARQRAVSESRVQGAPFKITSPF